MNRLIQHVFDAEKTVIGKALIKEGGRKNSPENI